MDQTIEKKSLQERIGSRRFPGTLRENPDGYPLYVPEENFALSAWDMSISEYHDVVQKATGLGLSMPIQYIFHASHLEEMHSEDCGLIPLIGNLYRLHRMAVKAEREGQENWAEGEPYGESWETAPYGDDDVVNQSRWNMGGQLPEVQGEVTNWDRFYQELANLFLRPFEEYQWMKLTNHENHGEERKK